MLDIEYKTVVIVDNYVTGQRARQLRKYIGVKQKYFAEIMGYSAQHLAQMEKGKRPWCKKKVEEWNKTYTLFQEDMRERRLKNKREIDRMFFGDHFVADNYRFAEGELERRKEEVKEILDGLPTEKKGR